LYIGDFLGYGASTDLNSCEHHKKIKTAEIGCLCENILFFQLKENTFNQQYDGITLEVHSTTARVAKLVLLSLAR